MEAYFEIRPRLLELSSFIKTTILLQKEIKEINDMVTKRENEFFYNT